MVVAHCPKSERELDIASLSILSEAKQLAKALEHNFAAIWAVPGIRQQYQRFLKEWCTRTMRSQLEPMKRVARTLRSHEELLLNWFRAQGTLSSGVVEGLNNKVKLTMRKSYGFRTGGAIELALYHSLEALPEPKAAHEFC